MKQLSNDQILGMIETQREAHQARLSAYQEISLPSLDDPALNRERTLQRLTLEIGIRLEQTKLDWLHMAHDLVQKMGD